MIKKSLALIMPGFAIISFPFSLKSSGHPAYRYNWLIVLSVIFLGLSGCVMNSGMLKGERRGGSASRYRISDFDKANDDLDEAIDNLFAVMKGEKGKGKLVIAEAKIRELKNTINRIQVESVKKGAQLSSAISKLNDAEELITRLTGRLKEQELLAKQLSLTIDKDYKVRIADLENEIAMLKGKMNRIIDESQKITANKDEEVNIIKETYADLIDELQKEVKQDGIKITSSKDRVSLNLVEKLLFDSGEAEINGRGKSLLIRLGDVLKGIKGSEIRIEGYTDNVPIGSRLRGRFPTNWELSMQRALNVVRYFQDNIGIDPRLLSATAYSQYRPVTPNSSEEGREQNRRIEIVVIPFHSSGLVDETGR